ncbi:MAG: glycoside hydrolase family 28 protein [Bryobacteraceae bacterium]
MEKTRVHGGSGKVHIVTELMRVVVCAVAIGTAGWCADFRVADYGAKGDGKTDDTAAIQRTFDAAAKTGGTIVLRPGVYLSGALFLKSGTHLRLDEGVVIRGVQSLEGYPMMPTRVAGIEMKWPAALINVYEQSGVRISGKGTIDGDGKIWWDKYWSLRRDYEPKGLRWAADYDCQRPRLIQVYKSSNVDLEGPRLSRSGFWTVHICYSQKVTVDGVTIRNNIGGKGPSTDGIDVDSSSNVLVEHCDIECNDDAICLKAGRDADGLRVNRPTGHVVIRDDTVRAGAAGITFGSETSGGIRDVEAHGIHVLGSVSNGILFKSASRRGGTVKNIVIDDMDIQGVSTAIGVALNWNPSYSYAKLPQGMTRVPDYWRVLLEPVPPALGLPHLRNVQISGIRASGAGRAFAVSSYADSPLENFTFKDVDIEAKTAGSIQNAENWKFTKTRIQTADGSQVSVKDSRGVTGLTP